MTTPEKSKRIIGLVLIALIMTVGGFVLAAVPLNTFTENKGGSMFTFNATGGYWVGANEVISSARAITGTTVDSVEYYLSSVNITEIFNTTQGATATVGTNPQLDFLPNYWYSDGVADNVQMQAAIDYIETLGGGELFIEEGSYNIIAQVEVDFSNLKIRGSGTNTEITDIGAIFSILFEGPATIYNFTVSDIAFIGDGTDLENHILHFLDCKNIIVRDCLFLNSGDEAITLGLGCRNGHILNNVFENCTSIDALGAAIALQSGYHIVEGNIIENSFGHGIALEAIVTSELIEKVLIKNNIIDADQIGIELVASGFNITDITITDNQIYNPVLGGIMDWGPGANISNVVIMGNLIKGGGTHADARGAINFAKTDSQEEILISGNTIQDWDPTAASKYGIQINSINSIITDNIISNVGDSGIVLGPPADFCIISNNQLRDIGGFGARYGIFIKSSYSICTDNLVEYALRGVRIEAGGVGNLVKNNLFSSVTTPMTDLGTDTKMSTMTLSFIEGTTLLSSAPFGWEIDAGSEYSLALGALPLEAQQVVRWKIFATSVVTETHNMTLQILGYGGADNQPYSTETVSIGTLNSTSLNFAANDVIFWTVTATDDIDLEEMFGGDQIMIQVLHEAASGGACETDAIFTCVIIEYV